VTLSIRSLSSRTSPSTQRALDRILAAARSKLVHRGEHLASVAERIAEAEGDPQRFLLYARDGGRALAIADCMVHAPEPGDLTIAQIAVAPSHHRRGLGRRLVVAAIAEAESRAHPIDRLVAAVHPDNLDAIAFWSRLGLVETADRTRVSVVLAARARSIPRP
jgi:ribosomal protein S18 acetylase RimI-like enzyme